MYCAVVCGYTTYSQGIGIEFGIENCAMLAIKSNKRQYTDGMQLPNQDKIRTLGEKETYNYLGILEADTNKQVEIKEKIKKKYIRRTRKLLMTKLYSRNLTLGKTHFVASKKKKDFSLVHLSVLISNLLLVFVCKLQILCNLTFLFIF